jgi:hypothetical protein
MSRVTGEGGSDFVPVPERIATFDNDGTLWAEKPVPFQLLFAFDRVETLAPQHPEWKTKEPFASRLFTEMVYQPMLELLAYLRANGFKTFIVSGGGVEFMRPWTEQVYGVPPEHALFVHHDDAAREYAYDRADKLQTFSKGWDEALAKGWTVVSVKNDWSTVFPPIASAFTQR